MAKKSDKEKSKLKSTRKEAIGREPFPNPPQHLPNSIAKRLNLLRNYPGITKSWLTTSKQCKQPRWHQLTEFTKSTRITPPGSWPNCRNILPLSDILKLHPYPPPPPENINIRVKSALRRSSSSLTLPRIPTLLVVTGVSNPAFMVYHRKLGEARWITHKSTTIDPYDLKKRFMKFTNNIIGFDGKLYAWTLQGALVVMEEMDARFLITGICRSRAVPWVSAKYFKEYLLESNGEILLVFLIYRKTITLADEIEVFRLDFDRLGLIKVERLEGRALFLENECCVWENSREVDCKGDCVYFRGGLGNGWWMYDMESGCISAAWSTQPIWEEPLIEE